MINLSQTPDLDSDESISDYLRDFDVRVKQATKIIPPPEEKDEDLAWVRTPAPNAIQWTVGRQWLNNPSTYKYWRQYQVIRDFFELRCPICNLTTPQDIDCWGKTQMYLEDEVLLEWSGKERDDVCPKCKTTRREFVTDQIFHNYNQMHGVTGMRCLPVSARVHTDRGLVRLADLLPCDPKPDTFTPINLVVQGEHGAEAVSDVYYAGESVTKVIKFTNGMEHTCSPIHPLYGYHDGRWDWWQAQQYRDGDYVEARVGKWPELSTEFSDDVIQGINNTRSRENYACNFVLPTKWSTELAAILGYLVSEGSVTYQYVCKFTNGDDETLRHFENLCKIVFNKSPVQYGGITVELAGAAIRDTLRVLGLGFDTAHTKRVPESIWRSNQECAAAFLRAYFEGDGTASVESGRHHKATIAAYTVSHGLALDIQQMLWNFGIDASVSSTKSRGFGTGGRALSHLAYSIRIYGSNIIKFADKIGFSSLRKRQALSKCVEVVAASIPNDTMIPHVGPIVMRLTNKVSLPTDLYHKIKGIKFGRYKSISVGTLVELSEYLGDIKSDDYELLKRITHPDARYLKIKSISDGPAEPMADLHVPGTHTFVANSILNHNSGKTATTSIIASYVEHRLYNIHYSTEGGISVALQQLPGQPFEITFIASSDVQSQDTIWAHYIARRKQSPWLQRYIQWVKKKEANAPKLNGVKSDMYSELDKSIDNGHLNISFNSLNSNSSGMAGRTRIAAYVDELSRFQNTESRTSADEAYRVLENSLATVRTMADKCGLPAYFGLMASISSPISIEDKSMRLWQQAPNIKRMYAFKYATWEFNPFITEQDLSDQFIKDPVGAKRDFGANPPAAASPLIEDEDNFRRQTITPDLKPTVDIEYYVKTDRMGNQYKAAKPTHCKLDTHNTHFIVFDAGLTFDTFAGASAHGEWAKTEDGNVWITVFDWVLRVLPERYPQRKEVWFDSVIELIRMVRQYHKIGTIEFDRWNSAQLIQTIRDMSVDAGQKGTTVTDFVKFVADANMGRVHLLPPEPTDISVEPHLISPAGTVFYEMTRLERSPDLHRVFNPKKGDRIGWNSDDVAQCVVHVHRLVQDVIAVDSRSALHSPEMRLKNEQVGGSAYGTSRSGRVFVPRQTLGTRGW